ncbi:MAG: hypothetical protein JWQ76_2071 [Ramlibacter sp.]|nr:hypothetical protein [Ramlibacter sp.]
MTVWSSAGPTVLASFLASMVEFVEALTIVLAVGLTRGWKSSLLGTVAGIGVLAALVAALGPSLAAVPLPLMQLVVGLLLLMFGLRWLHKAVLRAAGTVPLHDEALAFARQTQALSAAGRPAGSAIDGIAFMTTFKTVLLEGIEVVFVVIALGVRGGLLLPASAGALLALLLVAALGLVLHRPLARVPENTLKFAVGVMLTAFGTYWVGEGIGLAWPAQDASILLLVAVFLALALALVKACARLRAGQPAGAAKRGAGTPSQPGPLMAVAGELLGLFVDDLWLAVGVGAWVGAAALLEARQPAAGAVACSVFTAGLAVILSASAVRRSRASIG